LKTAIAPNQLPAAKKQLDDELKDDLQAADVIAKCSLADVLRDLDERAVEALAMIAQEAGRHSSTHTEHARLSSLELAIADLRTALRLAS